MRKCKCGNKNNSKEFSKWKNKNLCSTCNFWMEKIEIKDNPRVARINGSHYIIGNEDSHPIIKGFGGRRFVIKFDNGTIIETTNLWCQGRIPEHFRELLPNNAIFLKD